MLGHHLTLKSQHQSEPHQASKADLISMRPELKALFASELGVRREDLGISTGRIDAMEEDIHDLQIAHDIAAAPLLKLTNTCTL
ncbi:Hypothetical predicted protein [Pelobates cultripes]|uniref:Uncharacterized protein n=1 Tax=Pelobates cultripes TaxID=61616 RepID=A0AAD1S0I1_PELCU|nr:Hypothetical predicted protein [Pelobates cultripes]